MHGRCGDVVACARSPRCCRSHSRWSADVNNLTASLGRTALGATMLAPWISAALLRRLRSMVFDDVSVSQVCGGH